MTEKEWMLKAFPGKTTSYLRTLIRHLGERSEIPRVVRSSKAFRFVSFCLLLLVLSGVAGLCWNYWVREDKTEEAVLPPETTGDPVKDERLLIEAIRRHPKDSDLFHRLGNVFVRQNRWAAAEGAFQKAISWNPKSAEAFCNLGDVYFLMSAENPAKLDSAFNCYQTAAQLDLEGPEPHYNMARVYHAKRKQRETLTELEIVLKVDPNHAKALVLKRRIQP